MSSPFIAGVADALNQNAITYKNTINTVFLQKMVSLSRFKQVRVKVEYAAPNVKSNSDIYQGYQDAFTPNNDESMSSERWTLQDVKVDVRWTAAQLNGFRQSWMPSLSQFGDAAVNKTFFTNYLMYNVLQPYAMQAFENKMIYKGTKVTPTANTAGLTINAIDGLEKVITNAIAASKITPKAVGTITSVNVLDKLKLYNNLHDPVIRREKLDILCDEEIIQWALAALYDQNKYVTATWGVERKMELYIPFINKTLVGMPSMAGKQRLAMDISPTQDNLVFGLEEGGQDIFPVIRWQEFERTLKGLGETRMFVGVENFDNLSVSDGDA